MNELAPEKVGNVQCLECQVGICLNPGENWVLKDFEKLTGGNEHFEGSSK